MVSYQKLKHVVGDKLLVEAVCLSTDVKPIENIADSSKLTEQDTGKKYLFNGGTWYNVTEELPIEIEEPTLITLTQDTDIIDLATKAYNGEVLVQWYVDKMMDDTIPPSLSPLLLPCSPLVIPMDANNPFIIGFAANCIYVFGSRPESSLANNMKPAALVCVIRSTPNIQITKDDAIVCGVLVDMSSASSFTYRSIENFSEQYLEPKFLITPLYSKQQQVHPAVFVIPMFNEHDVRFYDGASGEELKVLEVEDGMQIPEEKIPEGYDYWTEDSTPSEGSARYSSSDIENMSITDDYHFYGWSQVPAMHLVTYIDGETAEEITNEEVPDGSIPKSVPGAYAYWFETDSPSGDDDQINFADFAIDGDITFYGWADDPRNHTVTFMDAGSDTEIESVNVFDGDVITTIPEGYDYWTIGDDPSALIVDPTNYPITDDISFYGWSAEPEPEPEPEPEEDEGGE